MAYIGLCTEFDICIAAGDGVGPTEPGCAPVVPDVDPTDPVDTTDPTDTTDTADTTVPEDTTVPADTTDPVEDPADTEDPAEAVDEPVIDPPTGSGGSRRL